MQTNKQTHTGKNVPRRVQTKDLGGAEGSVGAKNSKTIKKPKGRSGTNTCG
jgi:hypothetical protein